MTTSSDPGPAPSALEPVAACLACGGEERVPEIRTRAMMVPPGVADGERFTFVRCAGCGLIQLDPRVQAEELGRWYADWYLCYRGPAAWGPFAPLVAGDLERIDRARVARVREAAEVGPERRILDVGCGKPTFLRTLVEATGATGVGTDFSDAGWVDDAGRQRAEFERLQLAAGDLHDLAPPGSSPAPPLEGGFDLVTMWHYLEHDYAPARTLRRVREIAAREGRSPTLVIEVPNHDSLTRRRHGEHWAGWHTPRHTALWTPETMRVLLERTGWAPMALEGEGTLDPYVLDWMSRMERKRIDWSRSMAGRFPGFVAGMLRWKLLTAPAARRRGESLGVMTAVARVA